MGDKNRSSHRTEQGCQECLVQQMPGDVERCATTLRLKGSDGVILLIGCERHLRELVAAIGARGAEVVKLQ